ncbi:SDR family NAD(P)-dependent oxidoreductase [Nocardia brasiliensis]|uniref:SDR family NAD(P)-dependent oxidoreductase n=1 Tax=Nocardia brasiliensis TaxID=37326 RepID=A0A6G9XXD8_NOCBR|nr:SDR family NAD(P)-dependent oxidoreductase [Nocardia brasiliensis]QIS05609.1 SDR family NAD(P)-dependent oxidoreductase [Nocardia brasiliensis]
MSYIAITGASAGIGAAAAIELAGQGHIVLIVGRDAAKLEHVHAKMTAVAPAAPPSPISCDLADLRQVRALAAEILARYPLLDVLVNNAGVQPVVRQESSDGYELAFAVNHLAPFLLTNLLTERLVQSNGRVVTTSSSNHADGQIDFSDLAMQDSFSSAAAYDRSKLANVLFTREFRKRTGVPATSFHPGTISTDLNRDVRYVRWIKPVERLVMGSPRKGADTLTWLATSPEGGAPTADYYCKRRPAPVSRTAQDRELAEQLWEVSERMVGLSRR